MKIFQSIKLDYYQSIFFLASKIKLQGKPLYRSVYLYSENSKDILSICIQYLSMILQL